MGRMQLCGTRFSVLPLSVVCQVCCPLCGCCAVLSLHSYRLPQWTRAWTWIQSSSTCFASSRSLVSSCACRRVRLIAHCGDCVVYFSHLIQFVPWLRYHPEAGLSDIVVLNPAKMIIPPATRYSSRHLFLSSFLPLPSAHDDMTHAGVTQYMFSIQHKRNVHLRRIICDLSLHRTAEHLECEKEHRYSRALL